MSFSFDLVTECCSH